MHREIHKFYNCSKKVNYISFKISTSCLYSALSSVLMKYTLYYIYIYTYIHTCKHIFALQRKLFYREKISFGTWDKID